MEIDEIDRIHIANKKQLHAVLEKLKAKYDSKILQCIKYDEDQSWRDVITIQIKPGLFNEYKFTSEGLTGEGVRMVILTGMEQLKDVLCRVQSELANGH